MVAAACAWGVGEGLFDTGMRGIVTAPGSIRAAAAYAVTGVPLRAVGWLGAAIVVPIFFPTGQLPGPRWRWLGWTVVAALVAAFAGTLLDPHLENAELQSAGWRNPLTPPGPLTGLGNLVSTLGLLLMATAIAGGVAAMIWRWRRGDAPVRRCAGSC